MSYFSAFLPSGIFPVSGHSSKPGHLSKIRRLCFPGTAVLVLIGCTVEPLNGSRNTSGLTASTQEILASTSVEPVDTRVAQQVRNELLFGMNGGSLQPNGRYKVKLTVTPVNSNLSVQINTLAPTSSQMAITASYQVVERATEKPVTKGSRRAVANYDRTSQSFANERAQRDAENRAAKAVAQQVRLAIAQYFATR